MEGVHERNPNDKLAPVLQNRNAYWENLGKALKLSKGEAYLSLLKEEARENSWEKRTQEISCRTITAGIVVKRPRKLLTMRKRKHKLFFPYSWLALAFLLAGSASLLSLRGLPVLGGFIPDYCIYLDGAMRVLDGQRPQVDFHMPLGPLYFFLLASGLKLFVATIESFVYINILTILGLGVAAWIITSREIGSSLSLIFVAAIITASVNCHPWINYNPLCYAITALVLMAAGYVGQGRSSSLPVAFLAGILTGLVLFIKVNGFFISMVYAIAVCLLGRRWRWLMSYLFGLTLAILAIEVALDFQLGAQIDNTLIGIRIRGGMITLRAITLIVKSAPMVLAIPGLVIVAGLFLSHRSSKGRPVLLMAGSILFAVGLGLVSVASGSTGATSLVRYYVFTVMLPPLFWLIQTQWSQGGKLNIFSGRVALRSAVAVCVCFFALAGYVKAIGYLLVSHPVPNGVRIESSLLADVVIDPTLLVQVGKAQLIPAIVEGLAIMTSADRVLPAGPVFVLDYCNCLNVLSGRTGAYGDRLWWHSAATFSEEMLVGTAEHYLQHYNQIFIPKYSVVDDTTLLMRKHWGGYIGEHFSPALETQYWTVLIRETKQQ